MSTPRKAQGTVSAAAGPLKSGKGMSGTGGSDDGSTKYGTGGGEPPRQGQNPPKGNDKKKQPPKG